MRNRINVLSSLKVGLLSLMFVLTSDIYAADSKYLEDVTLPECNANNPEVQFISNNADWSKINDSSKRIFCVKPGDYSGAGTITLTADGSASKRRYIILDNGNDIHPAKLSATGRANVIFKFYGANYWTVDRLSTVNETGYSDHLISFHGTSTNNVLNRLYIDNFNKGIKIGHLSNNNTIQNSRIENQTLSARKSDGVAIEMYGDVWNQNGVRIYDTKILNNEIVNCSDGIQLVRLEPNGYLDDLAYDGTIIDNNHIYIENTLYTNCSGMADPNGKCAYAENAIDLKVGSNDASNPVIITNNHLWGYRKSDKTGSALSDWGYAIGIHFGVKNIVFEDNIVADSARGFGANDNNKFPYALDGATVKRNLFYKNGITSYDDADIILFDTNNIDVDSNWFVGKGVAYWLKINTSAHNTILTNNTVVDTAGQNGSLSSDSSMTGSSYYNDISEVDGSEDYIFTTDIFTNNPKQITLKNAGKAPISGDAYVLPVVEETPVTEPTPVVDETPVTESTPVVDETPVTESTPDEDKTGAFVMDPSSGTLK